MAFFSSCARGNRSSAEHIWKTNAPGNRGVCDSCGYGEMERLEYEGNVAVSDALRDDASYLIDLAPKALESVAHGRFFCEFLAGHGMSHNLEDLCPKVSDFLVFDDKLFERPKQNDAYIIKHVVFMSVLGEHQPGHSFLTLGRREYDHCLLYTSDAADEEDS